jgi:hypothetical protein
MHVIKSRKMRKEGHVAGMAEKGKCTDGPGEEI